MNLENLVIFICHGMTSFGNEKASKIKVFGHWEGVATPLAYQRTQCEEKDDLKVLRSWLKRFKMILWGCEIDAFIIYKGEG